VPSGLLRHRFLERLDGVEVDLLAEASNLLARLRNALDGDLVAFVDLSDGSTLSRAIGKAMGIF
jgi:hypothetical protein